MTKACYCKRHYPGSDPLVDQGLVHGWKVTWNPDDNRFYVHEGEFTRATFIRWSNAVRYCKIHNIKGAQDVSKA